MEKYQETRKKEILSNSSQVLSKDIIETLQKSRKKILDRKYSTMSIKSKSIEKYCSHGKVQKKQKKGILDSSFRFFCKIGDIFIIESLQKRWKRNF